MKDNCDDHVVRIYKTKWQNVFSCQFHTNNSHSLYINHIAPWGKETLNRKCLRKEKVLENLNGNHQKLNIALKNTDTITVFLAMCLKLIFDRKITPKCYFPVKNQIYCYFLTVHCLLKIVLKLLGSRNDKKCGLFPTFEVYYN